MASAHIYTLSNPSDVTVATGPTTILQLATGTTRRAWLKEVQISFKSVTAADVPLLIRLVRQSTAGTATAIAAGNNLAPDVEGHPASLSTGNHTATAEPTGAVVVKQWYCTPVGGLFVYQWPLGDEVEVAVSSFLGLVITTPQSEVMRGYLKFNE